MSNVEIPGPDAPLINRAEKALEHALKSHLGERMKMVTSNDELAVQVLIELHERVGLKEGF